MFQQFASAVSQRLTQLTATQRDFYRADVPDLYDRYLASFPEASNRIFRERHDHDCNTCKHFIRNLGAMVAIQNGEVLTLWEDLGELPEPYATVAASLAAQIKTARVLSVFRTKEPSFGHEKNRDNHDPSLTWYHFSGATPAACQTGDPGAKIGEAAGRFQVFKRGVEELTLEAIDQVLELIASESLYRGAEFKKALTDFRALKVASTEAVSFDLFCWENLNHGGARIRNTAIGTLLVDLSSGVDLETAVRSYESKVAPGNYRRPKPLITESMINQALKDLRAMGLEGAVSRRHASISDISVNDVLYVDNNVIGSTRDGLEALLVSAVKPKAVKRSGATEIAIDEFLGLRPKKIEIIPENKHLGNFFSLTAPVDPASGSLFSWGNPFGWSYDGDVADSVKERVKQAGGNVNALLRVSLSWRNADDLDIHCITPSGAEIYYGNKAGVLDVDMNAGGRSAEEPVENLAFNDLKDGVYKVYVHNFSKRTGQRRAGDGDGFTVETEYRGEIKQYTYFPDVSAYRKINCLTITVRNGAVEIVHNTGLEVGTVRAAEKWGVKTGFPARVKLVLLSPNHWDQSSRTGNKHWFFCLEDCLNPDPVRGIYNEFLAPELARHRKVFEVLGGRAKCQPSSDQLSGLGFSETRNETTTLLADGRPYVVQLKSKATETQEVPDHVLV